MTNETGKMNLPFWKEYPDRDTEFVRVYPTTKIDIDGKTIFHKKKTNIIVNIPVCIFETDMKDDNYIREDDLERYCTMVLKEMELYLKQPYVQDSIIESISFKGACSDSRMTALIEDIIRHIRNQFTISPDIEIGCEVLEEDLREEQLKRLSHAGIKKVEVVMLTGEEGGWPDEIVKRLENVGIKDIRVSIFLDSSAYELKMEYSSAYEKLGDRLRGEGYKIAYKKAYQVYAGYCLTKAEGADQNSWIKDMDVIGLGAGADGRLNECWYMNTNNIEAYYHALEKGEIPLLKGAAITKREQINRYILFHLATDRLDCQKFRDKFGFDMELSYCEELKVLEWSQIAEINASEIRLTEGSNYSMGRILEIFGNDNAVRHVDFNNTANLISAIRFYPQADEFFSTDRLWEKKPIGLYLHIPFCKNMCMSCPWYKIKPLKQRVSAYLEALKREITLYAQQPYIQYHYIDFGYMGGGTPTTLSEEQFEDLFEHIHKCFNFRKDIEFTVETTPVDLTESKLEVMMKMGINRISLGVQAFNDDDLNYIGRNYNTDKIFEIIQMIRKKGIKKLNIDIMYGTPGQTMQSWTETLEKALIADVTGIALYNYILIEKPSNIFKKMHGEIPPMPNEEMRAKMFYKAAEMLTAYGLKGYFGDEFSLPGYKNAYVVKPWEECLEQMSLGCFVQGLIKDHWFFNETELDVYMECVMNDEIPAQVGSLITPSDELRRKMILGVKSGMISINDYFDRTGVDFRDLFQDIIDDLEKKGLVRLTDTELEVVGPKGWYYLDNISKAFYEEQYKRYPQPCH